MASSDVGSTPARERLARTAGGLGHLLWLFVRCPPKPGTEFPLWAPSRNGAFSASISAGAGAMPNVSLRRVLYWATYRGHPIQRPSPSNARVTSLSGRTTLVEFLTFLMNRSVHVLLRTAPPAVACSPTCDGMTVVGLTR